MTEPPRPFRRLVVALGASRDSARRLELWAELARRLGADLSGVFVEDLDLLHMAGLPFASVVGRDSIARAFDTRTLEHLMRRAADEAREALEGEAARHALRCSFEMLRGVRVTAILSGVRSDDLLVVEGADFAPAAREGILLGARSVLYLHPRTPLAPTVFALASGDDDVLFAAAAHLAEASGGVLRVVVREAGADEEAAARAALARAVAPGVVRRLELVQAVGEGLDRLLQAHPGAVVAASVASTATVRGVPLALADLPCSLLLVRAARSAGADEPATP